LPTAIHTPAAPVSFGAAAEEDEAAEEDGLCDEVFPDAPDDGADDCV